MRDYTFAVSLPDEMADTLENMARRNDMTAVRFGAELIESSLATYRLPSVQAGQNGRYEPRETYPLRCASIECSGPK